MFHVLFLSHGNLSAELLKTAEMILGAQAPEVQAVSLPSGQDMELYKLKLHSLVEAAGADGVLILVDIMGGTPFMTVAKVYEALADSVAMEIVTGVNLPMAIEVLSARGYSSLQDAKEIAMKDGSGGVKDFVTHLTRKKATSTV